MIDETVTLTLVPAVDMEVAKTIVARLMGLWAILEGMDVIATIR